MSGLQWVLIMFAMGFAPPGELEGDKDLAVLAQWMSGHFSSEAQAQADQDFYNISLIMAPIWAERTDGYWFYVEQAVVTSLDKPYRQRVYHLRRGEGGAFESAVFTLEEPLKYAGVWQQANPLAKLSPKDLAEREGCTVILRKDGASFIGGTVAKNCHSSLRGSSYATSEISVYADRLVSWDRGFDANDAHVWGAEKGGYIFVKKAN